MGKGKYAGIIAGLEREVRGDSASYRERVEELKAKLDKLSSAELANTYGSMRSEKDRIDDLDKNINMRIAAVEEAMWDKFENEGITSLKLTNGRTVRIDVAPVSKVIDKEALMHWVRDNGLQGLLSLHAGTLNSLTNERLLAKELPPSGVEVKARSRTVYSK